MGPMDYSGAFAPQDPQQTMMQGLKDGTGIQMLQQQRAAAAAAQQQAQQKAQADAMQKQQMEDEMGVLSENPTAAGIAAFTIKYPHLSEGMKRSFDMIEPAEKKAHLDRFTQVHTAFMLDKPDIALKVMRDHATALRNSGDERGAGAAEATANLFETDPVFAKVESGKLVAAMAGPEKYAEAMAKMGGEQRADDLHGPAVDKAKADADAAESDAATKAVLAKHADSQALADLDKKRWDVKKIIADIGFQKESNRIAAMNADLARQSNDLKRQELQLKIKDAVTARDEKVRERVAQAEGDIAGVTDTVALIDQLFADPDSLKAVTGASAWKGMIPGTDNRTADGRIEQLRNMLAAANLDKLKGPMSDKDILFVKRISANIDQYQDEDQFALEMGKVRDIMQRTEKKLRAKFGAPDIDKDGKPDPAGGPRNIVVDY